jgi:hypothetical protein
LVQDVEKPTMLMARRPKWVTWGLAALLVAVFAGAVVFQLGPVGASQS